MIGSRKEILSLFRPWLLILPLGLLWNLTQLAMESYRAATAWPLWTFALVIVALLPVFSAMGWARRKMGAKPRPLRLLWFKPFFMRRENDGALNPFQYIWRFIVAIGLPISLAIELSMFFRAIAGGQVEDGVPGVGTAFFALLTAPIAFMFWEESRRRAAEKEGG